MAHAFITRERYQPLELQSAYCMASLPETHPCIQIAKFWSINLVKVAGAREKCALHCWDDLVAVSFSVHQLVVLNAPPTDQSENITDLAKNFASKLTSILLICLEFVASHPKAEADAVRYLTARN